MTAACSGDLRAATDLTQGNCSHTQATGRDAAWSVLASAATTQPEFGKTRSPPFMPGAPPLCQIHVGVP
jgi:hypothetical protein